MWHPLTPDAMTAQNQSTLTADADGTISVSGANPDQEVLEITGAEHIAGVAAIKLDALLVDPGGLGRSNNSNVVLSEIELLSRPLGADTEFQPIRFSNAIADHSQDGFPVTAAIDGKVDPETGWAVEGHKFNEPRTAIFVLEQPLDAGPDGVELRVRLRFESQFRQHVFNKFRLSVTERGDDWPVTMNDWHVVGPFKADDGQTAYQTEYGPEAKIDLGEPVGDAKLAWTKQMLADGEVHLFDQTIGSWYLYRRIDSPSERTVTAAFGSDDAIRVWVNGQPVHENNVARSVQPDQDTVKLPLKAGTNDLLVKIVNFGGVPGSSSASSPGMTIRQVCRCARF